MSVLTLGYSVDTVMEWMAVPNDLELVGVGLDVRRRFVTFDYRARLVCIPVEESEENLENTLKKLLGQIEVLERMAYETGMNEAVGYLCVKHSEIEELLKREETEEESDGVL